MDTWETIQLILIKHMKHIIIILHIVPAMNKLNVDPILKQHKGKL